MANYLEQILAATKQHNASARQTRSGIDSLLATLSQRRQADYAAMQAAKRAPAAPTGNPGGGGVHSMGDGHGHSSAAEVKGLNAEFNGALQRLIKDSGGKIKIGSGYRSFAEQQVLYDRYKRGVKGQAPAAPPGKSNHNHGLAADLIYSPGGREFAHRNAARYGLRFPMSYEPWHIEPVNARAKRGKK